MYKVDDLWKSDIAFLRVFNKDHYKIGEELYKWQIDHLASAMLVDDYTAPVQVNSRFIEANSVLSFPHGALISGSYVMNLVSRHMEARPIAFDDIDIYFQSKTDAESFAKANSSHLSQFDFSGPMCAYGIFDGSKINLIYGVEYDSPEHLISRFDIRACSMAIDPNLRFLYTVCGAVEDTMCRRITFNPVPRGVSVRRLTKYIRKGFDLDSHQGLFFAELVRTDIYSAELELATKKY